MPILTLAYPIWAFQFKEKFRVPKVMVVNEGFVIKGRFISWTGIASSSWAKDQNHYKLQLNTFHKNNGQSGFNRNISVNKRQYVYINEFLKARL